MAKKEKKTEWVMVETISTFRLRYMVEVPEGKSDKAIQKVERGEAKEFSQQHIGENTTSAWIFNKEQALEMCDTDNDYCSGWTEDKKIESFFTKENETASN